MLDDEIIVFPETRTLHMFAWRSTEISATPENYIENLRQYSYLKYK